MTLFYCSYCLSNDEAANILLPCIRTVRTHNYCTTGTTSVFTMSDSYSSITVNAVESSTPRAIVILCGWLGSRPRHIEKYAELWQERNCSTIHGIPDVLVSVVVATVASTTTVIFYASRHFSLLLFSLAAGYADTKREFE